jgi:2-polyprenyl-3-methyl-5-hydroxy-6-metoxy-1,4-benzoquinol methylase
LKDPNLKHYLKVKDFLVSGESFDLLYDSKKEMLITSAPPKLDELPAYYKSEDYISHTDSRKGFIDILYQLVKRYSLSKKVKLIQSLNKKIGSVLDIGAGTGSFLEVAKNKNWQVSGVEPNKKARLIANEKGLMLKNSIEELEEQQYDVVTLWHVLEHLPELEATVQKMEQIVKKGGYIIIAVPNFRSYDAKYYKEFWAAYDVPRHLWHFSRSSMKFLFSDKMKMQSVRPLIFDSFYVSLLSERYKTGNRFSIKAFFVGLRSNMAAWSSKEYSSLVYCYKKAE